LGINLQIVGE
jgi:hypothetical protein